MKSTSLIFVLSALVLATSCEKWQSAGTLPIIEEKYFINGDPLEIVKGTKLETKSFLSLENIQQFEGIELSGMTSFTERSERKDSNENNMEEIKKANKTPTEAPESTDSSATFEILENEKKVRLHVKQISDFFLEFEQKNEGGMLDLVSVEIKKQRLPVTPVHYSVTPDRTAFSMLFTIRSEDEYALIGFSFHKKAEKSVVLKVVESAKDFFYLFGKGILIPQEPKKTLSYSLCGRDSEIFSDEIRNGINPWKTALQDRLEIEYKFQDSCAPILDVNHQSLHFIENRIMRVSARAINSGVMLPRTSMTNGILVGSDILIWKGEFKRVSNGEVDSTGQPMNLRTRIQSTIMHEFGHVLGLGHPFESKSDSIMGYDGKINSVTDYDIQAVQALYPKIN